MSCCSCGSMIHAEECMGCIEESDLDELLYQVDDLSDALSRAHETITNLQVKLSLVLGEAECWVPQKDLEKYFSDKTIDNQLHILLAYKRTLERALDGMNDIWYDFENPGAMESVLERALKEELNDHS